MDCQHNDVISGDAEIDRVWKAPQHRPPCLLMNPLIAEGFSAIRPTMSSTALANARPRPTCRCSCQSRVSCSSSSACGLKTTRRATVHPSSLRRTSAHGTAESGFATCSAQRLSSSARNSSVIPGRHLVHNRRGSPTARSRAARDPERAVSGDQAGGWMPCSILSRRATIAPSVAQAGRQSTATVSVSGL